MPQAGGDVLQDVRHTWDDGGNLEQRDTWLPDSSSWETEYFEYDFLDRLTGVTGTYTDSWRYDEIGNMTYHNGTAYSYTGYGPHAVSGVEGTSYEYDENGNMTKRDGQEIGWDRENRPVRFPAEDTDIGPEAKNRSSYQNYNYTLINLDNPAEADGTVENVEAWANTNLTGLRVGTFYLVSGTTYKCRDSVSIGSVTSGSKWTFTGLSLDVAAGDYIGCFYTAGRIEKDTSGYGGVYYKSGEYIDPGDQASYSFYSGDAVSLRGIVNTDTTFVYDGDGDRVKKIEGGVETVYVNKYYELVVSGNATSYYYLGDRLVAMCENTTLRYIHLDHLTGTSVVSDENGSLLSSIKYAAYGLTRAGSVPTDKKFTGQRLDATGLYYYSARYYDTQIGRFISPDTVVPDPRNPQAFNRYAYCLNNPLKYVDPSGHQSMGDYLYWAWYYGPYGPGGGGSGGGNGGEGGGASGPSWTVIGFNIKVTAEAYVDNSEYALYLEHIEWLAESPITPLIHVVGGYISNQTYMVAEITISGQVTIIEGLPGWPTIIQTVMNVEGEGIDVSFPVFSGMNKHPSLNFSNLESQGPVLSSVYHDSPNDTSGRIPMKDGSGQIYVSPEIIPLTVSIRFQYPTGVLSCDRLVVDIKNNTWYTVKD